MSTKGSDINHIWSRKFNLSEKANVNHSFRSNKKENSAEVNSILFFSKEDIFDKHQSFNGMNDNWLCSEELCIMHTEFPANVLVLENDMRCLLHSTRTEVMFLSSCVETWRLLRRNFISVANIEKSVIFVKPWIESICNGSFCVFQEDIPLSHKALVTHE